MSRLTSNFLAALPLSFLLAACQSFPAVQQDLSDLGASIGGATKGSTATSMPRMPGFGGGTAAPAAGATAGQVTDPFAGQGVATPAVPGQGGTAAAASGGTAKTVAATTHRVVAGETGWSVARKYGVTVQELASANGTDTNMTLRVGQVLKIPARTVTAQASVTAPGQGSPTPTPPSAAKPLPDEKTAPTSAPTTRPDAPDLGGTRTAASGSGKLRMPVAGSITRPFSKGRNDGIDIAAGPGVAVQAAAGGTVAAVTRDTDGVPIVVIRHQGDLMTVYAGMSALSVQKGDTVSSGQSIGTAGNSGSIHFEVRQGFEAVNPEGYL
ncbi:M23 family metallopeptidase [Paracoccus jeotgali]|uniref:Peptidase M23 n=1 Tax=Paracoccus jeotgali TaxID=2065379 RepID=A0A2K9MFY5_9RHOB|nr:M23 family metallopeptidase [Paracoccus jeotgali]AUM73435.1 peptidase M23 [Paracoccus jeotgali]